MNDIFRISHYATAKTDQSVFIIGGFTAGRPGNDRIRTIAEYKDGSWRNAGNLVQARYNLGAITLGSTVMIVGGGG